MFQSFLFYRDAYHDTLEARNLRYSQYTSATTLRQLEGTLPRTVL